jgi:PKD repeat protein
MPETTRTAARLTRLAVAARTLSKGCGSQCLIVGRTSLSGSFPFLVYVCVRGGAWAGLTVKISRPDANPAYLAVDEKCDFAAVADSDDRSLAADAKLTWAWDFGDGSDLAKTNPAVHSYTAPGEYHVNLTVVSGYEAVVAHVTVIVYEYAKDDPPEGVRLVFSKDSTPDPSGDGGGETCDGVQVDCRAQTSWFPANHKVFVGARFFKKVNGVYVRQDNAGSGWVPKTTWGQYTGSRLSPVWNSQSPDDHNVLTDWKADYQMRNEGGGGGTQEYHVYASITPNNTVVTSSTDPLILHNTPTESHTITWNITHMNFGPPLYTVMVYVYDLSGAVKWHAQLNEQPLGSGQVTWYGTLDAGGNAPKGIYTFLVSATHQDCHDQDKADVISNVSVSDLLWVVYAERARVTLHYTLAEALSGCKVKVFRPDLAESTVSVPTNGELPGATGLHELTVEFAVYPSLCGTYRFAITGTQANGSANRDGNPKAAVPRGAETVILPDARLVAGQGEWSPYMQLAVWDAGGQLALYPGISGELPYTVSEYYDPLDPGFAYAVSHAALFFYCGHGSNDRVCGTYSPPNYFTIDELSQAGCPHLLLAVWYNCNSSLYTDGNNWVDYSRTAGADCAIGWDGEPWLYMAPDWARSFWHYLAMTMDADLSCYDASWETWQLYPVPVGILTYRVSGDVSIDPTRFGE